MTRTNELKISVTCKNLNEAFAVWYTIITVKKTPKKGSNGEKKTGRRRTKA
jgi:hypothetical protein